MNSSLLKFGAILLFAAGIIGFVAYRSGFFDAEIESDATPNESENTQEKDLVVDKPQDTLQSDESLLNPDETPHLILSDEIEQVIMSSSKSIQVISPVDFEISEHMGSSKSGPVFNPNDFKNSNGDGAKPDTIKNN